MKVEPYFMKNEAWYRLKDGGFGYELTAEGKKVPEAVASYEEYYKDEAEEGDELVDA